MNAANYLGFSDWRLPTLTPVGGGTTFNTTTSNNGSTDVGWGFTGTESELAHLWYSTLENLGLCEPNGGGSTTSCIPQAGSGLMNTGPFQDLSFSFFGRTYWTGEEFAPSPSAAWTFGTRHGTQTIFNKNADFLVWAVHSGDVAALPEPGSIALFGLGLLGLIVAQRRHRVGA